MSPHPAPYDCTRCARPGDNCWACKVGHSGNEPESVPPAYCWHSRNGLMYPLCEQCAQRWRAWREAKGDLPLRLHIVV